MAPVPIPFFAGAAIIRIGTVGEGEFRSLVEVESAVKAVEVVEERSVEVVDGSAENGPTVLPIAV